MQKRIEKAIESKIYTSCEHKLMFSPCEIGFEFHCTRLVELPTQGTHSQVNEYNEDDEIEVQYTLLSVKNNLVVYEMKRI